MLFDRRIGDDFLNVLLRAAEQRPASGDPPENVHSSVGRAFYFDISRAVAQFQADRAGNRKGALEGIVTGRCAQRNEDYGAQQEKSR